MDKDTEEAKAIIETHEFYNFFTNLFEKHKELIRYYLADNVVLHWFGHTVKGVTDASIFVKTKMLECEHHFDNITIYDYADMNMARLLKAPTATSTAPVSTMFERGQGDGIHNNIECSPIVKRIKLEYESKDQLQESESTYKSMYLLAEGAVGFQKPSAKKHLHETKWKRPCRLHVAYTCKGNQDYTIHYVIYEGNVKCRRNLLNEFSAEESEY